MAVAPFVGFPSYSNDPWGSASLHPRLYAIAAFRGLNPNFHQLFRASRLLTSDCFMKLAYFSPLSPLRSGISDYSEELLPHLAEAAEITLFVDGFHPVNRELNSRFEIRDYRRQRSSLRALEQFDAVVYHMGNDHRYHAGILDAMQKRSGVVVFHDFALQEFFLGLSRSRNDLRLYLDEVEFCHGRAARDAAAETLARGAQPSMLAQPIDFVGRVGSSGGSESGAAPGRPSARAG